MDSLVTVIVPAFVGVLTAVAAVIGLEYRDVDAYERRRAIWQWLLVLLATVATAGATNSASGVGHLITAAALGTFAAAAVILAHIMWRKRVPDAEPRILGLATSAAVLAVLVVAGSVTLTYIQGKGCRQADPLIQSSLASSGAILPVFDANQGPTTSDFDNWAKIIREQAQAVTVGGDIAQRANKIGDLAGQIADAYRAGDKNKHAALGADYYDELKFLLTKCHPQG
ncbi:hypothetical protein [Mycolicibacterium goodii]|uniref:DUF4239 domain-containing protein n=1 Tax=Mycolicibacterium goodii TaxID=134601 RepID=A0A0K0X0U8_MYCGD|nr:hypothetical protein AFA91_03365 [Mycolicibacterium goodii]